MKNSGKLPRNISWRRNLVFIWLGQLLAMAGSSMVIPFMPIYFRVELGLADEAQRAWATSLFYTVGMLSFCISNPLWGALGDRFGRKIMLLRAYFVTGITFPAMIFMPNMTLLLIMRFVASMFSGTVSAAQALTAVTTPDQHQGFALGSLSAAFWSGNMLGMLSGGLLAHYFGYMTTFMLCGAFFITSGLLTLFFVEENFVPPLKLKNHSKSGRKIALPAFSTGVWILLGVLFLLPLARRCDEPFLPLLVEFIGGMERAEINTGWITAASALGGIMSGIVFGHLSDKYKPLTLAAPALLAAGGFMLMQAAANSLWMLALARFMVFFAAGGLEPVFLAMISHSVNPDLRGTVFGWGASARVFGGMAGALVGGAATAYLGVRGVFALAGIIMLSLILLIIPAIKKVERMNCK
ncbi:MAG: multidrug efflux MFS transporter [Lentisphaerae bacterium]|nr:multidrug efflux MFS transporter [Lentisphaerota bacterium]